MLSEDLDIDGISFAKVRLGQAQVGNDTDPYRASTTYAVVFQLRTAVPPRFRTPRTTRISVRKTSEFGLELNLFLDRVRFDFTYYNSTTEA